MSNQATYQLSINWFSISHQFWKI